MNGARNLDNILDSVKDLRKHLEDADSYISSLEEELDREAVYQYVDAAMSDIKLTYSELLKYICDLESDLENLDEYSNEDPN